MAWRTTRRFRTRRNILISTQVADKVGAKETGQLIDLLPWNRPDYPLKPKKGSGL